MEPYSGFMSRDVIIFGGLTHDIGKIVVIQEEPKLRHNSSHSAVGANIVFHKLTSSGCFTEQQVEQLVNIILAHHREYQANELTVFLTYEAQLISYADSISASIRIVGKNLSETSNGMADLFGKTIYESYFD